MERELGIEPITNINVSQSMFNGEPWVAIYSNNNAEQSDHESNNTGSEISDEGNILIQDRHDSASNGFGRKDDPFYSSFKSMLKGGYEP